ncbi:MAG: glutamine synthetase family protein [Meiothermus sp.]|nr:glutamine synthetase family protein [Meiothermus sp.]
MRREELEKSGVQWVRVLWCDHANLIRAKAVHVSMLEGFEGIGISAAQQALPVMFDAVAPGAGLGPVGDSLLAPDWSTLKPLPFAPAQAQVIGDMRWEGGPWEYCPREYLRGQMARLKARGLEAFAAFENEFFLLQRTEAGYVPADRTVYAQTQAMNQQQAFVGDFTEALIAQGLRPEFYYPESAPGQVELSVRYAGALEAADNQIAYRETARGVAARHGVVASFLPKVVDGAAGSGCHLNLSLWEAGRNVTPDPAHPTGLSESARAFIAGVLAHLPALCALTIPSRNSYRRILPHYWAGAYRAWGSANREAAVRVSRGQGGAGRFELKTADASANPYLALGGLIAAGLDGLEHCLELPPEATQDPALLSQAEREAAGIDVLPQSLEEALGHLRRDPVLLDSLGPARAQAYLAVKHMEWEALKGLSLDEEVRMLAERY